MSHIKNPTLEPSSFHACGVTFYENPVYGDEAPLMVMFEGKYYETELYDLPTEYDEAQEYYNNAIAGLPLDLEDLDEE